MSVPMTTAATPKLTRSPQRSGDRGVYESMTKVAQKIAEGRLHPDVVRWARTKLKEAGNPMHPALRAQVLLEALRKQSGWVPDPVDSEYIPPAHLMLGDGDSPPYFALGDCDDLTVALQSAIIAAFLLAAVESVGTRAAIVGHSYTKDRQVSHVLGAVYVPGSKVDGKATKGGWYYMDPSLPNMPFGSCKTPFTREIVILVPSGETLCDAGVCLLPGGVASGKPPEARKGDFVSLSGAHDDDDDAPLAALGLPYDVGCDEDDPTILVPQPDSAADLRERVVHEKRRAAGYDRAAEDARRAADLEQARLEARRGIDIDAFDRRVAAENLIAMGEQQRLQALAARCGRSVEYMQKLIRDTQRVKNAMTQNLATFNEFWQNGWCGSRNPLEQQILNNPPTRDYAAHGLFQPWNGPDAASGASYQIPNSGFPRP